ncbi:MAG: FecR domain-containing protein [Verrucomicrobiota bacterium]
MIYRPSSSSLWEKILRGSFLASVLFLGHSLSGAQPAEIRITQVVKNVKLLAPQVAPRVAVVDDKVRDNSGIRTGPGARCELTFADQAIARLGANSLLEFSEGTQTMNLGEGAMLFQIPKGVSGAKIKTAAITVSSTGATGIIERHGKFYIKFLLLEGEARLYMADQIGESVLVHAGQILITKPGATALPDPAHFDIARMMKTCRLVSEFRPLPSKDLIKVEEQKQTSLTSLGTYVPSNLVIFGRGTLVSLVQPEPPARSERKTATNRQPTN